MTTFHVVLNSPPLRISREFDSLGEALRFVEKLAGRWGVLVAVAETRPGCYRLLRFAAPLGGL